MKIRLAVGCFSLLLVAEYAAAGGSAAVISEGARRAPGVVVSAQKFAPATATGEVHMGGSRFSATVSGVSARSIHVVINNRCTATNLGGGFSYNFSIGVECASFEPPPDEPARKRKRPRVPSPEEIALALADRAMSLAPDPHLRVTPGRVGLAGLESYFWLADPPGPIRATASAGRVSVTAEARPTQFVWDFDDGSDHVTYNPGRRWTTYREGNIGHMYQAAGRYDLSVDVVWEARWRMGAGAWRHLGYFSTSDSRPYAVRQVIAMLVRPGWQPR